MEDEPANGFRVYVNRDGYIFQQSTSDTKLQRIRKVSPEIFAATARCQGMKITLLWKYSDRESQET